MGKKGLKALEEALKADESLRQKYEEALKGVTGAASDGEVMQKAAAQLGYEVSLVELEQACAKTQKLDAAELDAVAGGQDQYQDYCFAMWCCYTVTRHPDIPDEPNDPGCPRMYSDKSHTESCLSNYNCIFANKTSIWD